MASGGAEETLKNLVDKATYERLEKDLAKVKNEMSALADQLSNALRSYGGEARAQARRGFRQARENVDAVLSDVSEHGGAAMDAAQDAAASIEETVEDAIRQRPIAAIGLAIVALADGYFELAKHVWLASYLVDVTAWALLGAVVAWIQHDLGWESTAAEGQRFPPEVDDRQAAPAHPGVTR